jgi:hypothetical protein
MNDGFLPRDDTIFQCGLLTIHGTLRGYGFLENLGTLLILGFLTPPATKLSLATC